MTRKKVGPFRGGRKRKLTPAQQVELLLLAAELRELGPMRRAVDQGQGGVAGEEETDRHDRQLGRPLRGEQGNNFRLHPRRS